MKTYNKDHVILGVHNTSTEYCQTLFPSFIFYRRKLRRSKTEQKEFHYIRFYITRTKSHIQTISFVLLIYGILFSFFKWISKRGNLLLRFETLVQANLMHKTLNKIKINAVEACKSLLLNWACTESNLWELYSCC